LHRHFPFSFATISRDLFRFAFKFGNFFWSKSKELATIRHAVYQLRKSI
jgi:hypothetical protein